MPTAKVIKPKTVEASRKPLRDTKPVKVRAAADAESQLLVPAMRNGRASSCPRCPRRTASVPGCQRRARSGSAAAAPATNPEKRATVNPNTREASGRQRDPRSVRQQSHKAFTMIPPDPKKRRDIQRKAEAELAALEALRLSKVMAYVSISPSSVGGCMSLEEVRLKQQQEMMQAKRTKKLTGTQVMQRTHVMEG